jgi:hypothetical protein
LESFKPWALVTGAKSHRAVNDAGTFRSILRWQFFGDGRMQAT